MQKYILCSDGKKRKCVTIICDFCGKEHHSRIRPSRNKQVKYCSQQCAAKANSNRVSLTCSWCKSEFTRAKSKTTTSKSKLYFCTRKCKDEAQKLGGIKEIQPPHFGTSQIVDYRAMFDESELICARCKYKEFICSIDIHHIDKDRTNNNKSNLIPLCSCCHMALHRGAWDFSELS